MNFGARKAAAVILECQRQFTFVVSQNGVRNPGSKQSAQLIVGFHQAAARKGKYPDIRQIIESENGG